MKKLIVSEGTEFEQNGKDLALIETEDRAGIPTMISSADLNEGFSNADSEAKEKLNFDIQAQSRTVDPTTTKQDITPESGYNCLSKVTVNAVTSAIDANIAAGNIKSGVTILGVEGSVVELVGETAEVTPTTSAQTITPVTGNGITSVSVNPVTSAIDANIAAGNIKDGVTILGVEGTYVKPEDANLIPGNIKHGVTIYGVEGTYTGDDEPQL